jgi:hypothetical protein
LCVFKPSGINLHAKLVIDDAVSCQTKEMALSSTNLQI